MLVEVDFGDKVERRDDPVAGDSLQARFESMRLRRLEAQKRVAAADSAKQKPKRSKATREKLRAKFVEQVNSYLGVPYSKKASGIDAPKYLDCCNLVRRCVLDLKEDFGFTCAPAALPRLPAASFCLSGPLRRARSNSILAASDTGTRVISLTRSPWKCSRRRCSRAT